ncbi:MAG: hypothetical protein ACR2PL_05405 [Dehalococcoidia bacterium]
MAAVGISGGEPEVAEAERQGPEPLIAIHMPTPSYWPIVVAIGLTTALTSVIYTRDTHAAWISVVVGLAVMFSGVFGWASQQPGGEPEYVPASVVARSRMIPGQVTSSKELAN